MNALFRATSPALAGSFQGVHMIMPWFIPIAIVLGVLGTRTGLHQRHLSGKTHRDRSWWLIFIIAWLPAVCWTLAQFIQQY
jgi:hypothetical protein